MNKAFIGILFLLLAAACAEENKLDTAAFQDGAFGRWMEKYHPQVPLLTGESEGIYAEWLTKNPEGARLREGYWMEMDYTIRDQIGDIYYSRSRSNARLLLGPAFDHSVHYVPEQVQYFPLEMAYAYPSGQIRLLRYMNEGDSVRLYLAPQWGYSSYAFTFSSRQSGYAVSGTTIPAGTGLIVDLCLNRVIKDIDLYERDRVTRWAADSLGITNPADSIALGVYLKKTIENPTGEEIDESTTVNVYYTVRFLDGHLFDTNVESVARAHGVVAASGPTRISLQSISDYEVPTVPTLVPAMKDALLQMKTWEGARFVFVSDRGFMAGGLKSSSDGRVIIPPYTPLEYEIYLENAVYN